ncbi:MAG: F0F1 ATP synthase subunit epsilon [Muribaculaceae bacterium]|nr:F0F1 ATP synthase subunit epsilon [Muribaculaceae bacterium]
MTLKIISAEKIEFEGQVEMVTLPGAMGSFQVLKNHAAIIAALTHGQLSYVENGKTVSQEIHGGVADIKNNEISVCLY